MADVLTTRHSHRGCEAIPRAVEEDVDGNARALASCVVHHLLSARVLQLNLVLAFLNRQMLDDEVVVKELSDFGALQHRIEALAPRAPRGAKVNQNVLLLCL